MKIAIVGGLGFIGTNLYYELNNQHDVLILDNYTTKKNLKFLKSAKIYKVDLLEEKKLIKLTKGVECIINLAAQTGVLESNVFPEKSIKLNILGTLNILKCCKYNKIKHFINASTAGAIYGNTGIANELTAKNPISFYGLTKKFAEDQIALFLKNIKTKNTNLRFSNVYGSYSLHKTSLIHNSITNLLKNKTQLIFGSGYQMRDFIYVRDLTKIIKNICEKKIYGTYNIASGSSCNVKKIIKNLILIDNRFKFKHVKKKIGEVDKVKIDNSKIIKKLRMKKSDFTDIKIAIKETFIWYKKNFKLN